MGSAFTPRPERDAPRVEVVLLLRALGARGTVFPPLPGHRVGAVALHPRKCVLGELGTVA